MQRLKSLDKSTLLHIGGIAWPMALNAILIESVTLVDLLLVASLGDISVAAFGIGGALIAFIISIQFAIGNASQLVISRAVGAGDVNKVGVEVASAWIFSIGFTLPVLLILIFGNDAIINLVAHDEQVAAQAMAYVKASLWVIFFSSFTSVMVAYFNAHKKTRIPLYGFLLEIPLNIVCSAPLIHGLWGAPELGLAGAAWGSVIAIAMRLVYLGYQLNKQRLQGYVAGFTNTTRTAFIAHFHEAFPMMATFLVLFTGLLIFQALFAQLPVSSYAAITLILPWIKVGSLFVNSWTQSSTILVSQTLGKKDYRSIPNLVMQTEFICAVMCIFMVIGFYFFSLAIPSLYTNLSPETIVALSIIAPVYIAIPIFRVHNMLCGNMIRSMGEGYVLLRINLTTQWLVAIPVCALFIYFDAPLVMVFGVLLIDEILKFYPFRRTLNNKLATYA